MIKADGSVLVHADAGGYRPLKWMTPPTVIEEAEGVIVVRKRAGRSEDRLEIPLVQGLREAEHAMGAAAPLQKDRRGADLQGPPPALPAAAQRGPRLDPAAW